MAMMNRRPLLVEAAGHRVHKLHIFDMDGTLLLSPEPKWGKEHYRKHHPRGKSWEEDHGKKWWSNPTSLTGHPHKPFPIKPIEDTVKGYHAAHREKGSRVVVMTGRQNTPDMRQAVSHVLKQGNITDHKGRDLRHGSNLFLRREPHPHSRRPGRAPEKVLTHVWKGEMIHKFADQHPNLKHIHIWDDRPDHAKHLAKIAKERGIATTINHVQDPEWKSNMPDTA
jgi:hypothetical protein